jgi:hypothetical protein
MGIRCRVLFFDLLHEMNRSIEVQEACPVAAAEVALKRMLERDQFVSDFAGTVQVEVISTARYALPIEAIAARITEQKRIA